MPAWYQVGTSHPENLPQAPRKSFFAAEINQRYGPTLKRKKDYDPRQVSVVLCWMAKTGRVVRTQKGRPWSGSQYVKTGG